MSNLYKAFYSKFYTKTKKEGSVCASPDCIVGDIFRLDFEVTDGSTTAVIFNKFDRYIGYFDEQITQELLLLRADGKKIDLLLSFVAYRDTPGPALYWGEFAVISYNSIYSEEFNSVVSSLSAELARGKRPSLNLEKKEIDLIIENCSGFTFKNFTKREKLEPGSAFVKTKISPSEKLVESGRKGKLGCWVATFLFFLIIVFVIVYLVQKFL